MSNSATDALLWLKRALEFIHALIVQIINGQSILSDAAVNAYKLTLSKYHGWVVRGIFNLAMKSVPYRDDFFIALGPGNEDMVIHSADAGIIMLMVADFERHERVCQVAWVIVGHHQSLVSRIQS